MRIVGLGMYLNSCSGQIAAGCGYDCVAEEGRRGVSDAGESVASGADVGG